MKPKPGFATEQSITDRLAAIEARLQELERHQLKHNELAAARQLKRLQTVRSK
jgi:hypothetical protein